VTVLIDSPALGGELERHRRAFLAIERDARDMLHGLSDAQLAWKPVPNAWSIAECLDHLVVTGRQSVKYIAEAAGAGRARGLLAPGPFRYNPLERWMVWVMEPPARLKFPAPRAYRPPPARPGSVVVTDFFDLQHGLLETLGQVNGLDLVKIRVRNPVSRWITFSLGKELAFTVAHERRHLWQARRVRTHPAFPGVSGRS
jgi:hypothetical protein